MNLRYYADNLYKLFYNKTLKLRILKNEKHINFTMSV